MYLRLFGRSALTGQHRPPEIGTLPKCSALLVYLAIAYARPVPRKEAAFALWPDLSEDAALSNLRRHVFALIKALPASPVPWILTSRASLQWNAQAPWSNDVIAFDRAIGSPVERGAAAAVYRDDLAIDLDAEWIETHRRRYRDAAISLFDSLSLERWTQHDAQAAIAHTRALLRVDPLREAALQRLMAMLHQAGDRAAALAAYDEFKERLYAELDADPMPATMSTAAAIRGGSAVVVFENNLPAHLTPFLGRERELTQTSALLREARLLTLVGSAGIGKTRLAVALASFESARFRDGAFFADLTTASDAQTIAQVVASAAGAVVTSGRSPGQAVDEHFRQRTALLVLDNCEHIIDESAHFCDRMLRSAPHLTIVATSREPLRLNGEVAWRVPSLVTEDARALFEARMDRHVVPGAHTGAIEAICARLDGIPLAIELAAAATSSISVSELRTHLDEHFNVLDLGSRTDIERHRTVRATLEWSYALLSPPEQRLLSDLSAFAGGATPEAVAAVCLRKGEIATLDALVQKSLLEIESREGLRRYRLLEATRAFALERRGSAHALKKRHAWHYRDLAAEAEPHFADAGQAVWIARLHADLDNVRAALSWFLEARNDVSTGVQLALSMRTFWQTCGYYDEGERWMELALTVCAPESRDGVDCLNSLGTLHVFNGPIEKALAHFDRAESWASACDYEDGQIRAQMGRAYATLHRVSRAQARPLLKELLVALRRSGSQEHRIATTLGNLAFVDTHDGDLSAAQSGYEEALGIFELLGDGRQAAWITYQLARLAFYRGDIDRALSGFEQSLAARREFDDRRGIAETLCALGEIALAKGETDRAGEMFGQSARLSREIWWQRGMAVSTEGLAGAASMRGDSEWATRALGSAAAFRAASHIAIEPADQPAYDVIVQRLKSALGHERFASEMRQGERTSLVDAVGALNGTAAAA